MSAKVTAILTQEAIRHLQKAIKKDQENLYSLDEECRIPLTVWAPPVDLGLVAFEDRHNANGRLCGSWLVLRAYKSTRNNPICDGATYSPDAPKGVIEAAIVHDPLYIVLILTKRLPKEWEGLEFIVFDGDGNELKRIKITRRAVRKLCDDIFYSIIQAEGGSPLVAMVYYKGTRAGYPFFKLVQPFFERGRK